MENVAQNPSKVELTLMGIEKKWVRGPKGQWRDKSKMKVESVEMQIHEPEESSKKWWKFWSRT